MKQYRYAIVHYRQDTPASQEAVRENIKKTLDSTELDVNPELDLDDWADEFEVDSSKPLSELHRLLDLGWIPVRETPMGATGGRRSAGIEAFSLVLLEKDV